MYALKEIQVAILFINTEHKKRGLENTSFIEMMIERTAFFHLSISMLLEFNSKPAKLLVNFHAVLNSHQGYIAPFINFKYLEDREILETTELSNSYLYLLLQLG